ncbi:MAG TPA: hypothetical protein PKD05_11700 [Candidatus Melainabacteria bacterium]|nr:hypothetical protein [Candidatus Melainabacteria bacterium]HMP52206.1 hypothetical protein [Candidatus Melainabacteria bacterium]
MSEKDQDKNNDVPLNHSLPNPQNDRRNRAANQEAPEVKFATRGISEEKLESLKNFLKNASADDIKVIRDCYGDNPEVLRLIGLELTEEQTKEN